MIVTPKKPPKSVLFRWDPALIDEVRAIAERTGRTMNEAGEMLMRWAVDHEKAEIAMVEPEGSVRRKKKD